MKEYIGDSVYVEYTENEAIDGLILTTENGGLPSNTIFMEDSVFENLIIFVNKIREMHGSKPIIIPKGK